MILEHTIKQASKFLKKNNISSHELDAEVILADILKVNREFLITNNNLNISEEIRKKYNFAITRRVRDEPVAYITGKKEFWDYEFFVNYRTLIPRPETELLLYKVLKIFNNKMINILDIGTGSGCILLSILKVLKFSRGIGIDISPKAVRVAKQNSLKLNLSNRSKFMIFDINKFNAGKYDLIISNPPYIPIKDLKNLDRNIKNYEPLVALKGGIDGLELIKKVVNKSKTLLKTSGLLAIEIGNNQYLRASNFLKKQGFREIAKEYDYRDNVRCIISTKM